MPSREDESLLEDSIAEWRSYLSRRQAVRAVDADELEDHLRTQLAALQESGLAEDEAFLIAVKRIGDLDSVAREFAQEYSERLWKRLVLSAGPGAAAGRGRKEAGVAVGLAIAAAALFKLPELFGIRLHATAADAAFYEGLGLKLWPTAAAESFYARNLALFVLPLLAGFFAWKRGLARAGVFRLAAPFVVGALAVNVLPFAPRGYTEALAALHLPLALWLAVGFAYAGGLWRAHEPRMNYIRFSGEWLIYFALIGLGGMALMASTMFVFGAIGLNPERLLQSWILPCGAMGAVIIAAWLVEAKQSVIENMAPVLTLLFTPLFTLLLLAFLATMLWTGSAIDVKREVLIGFDLLLVVVVALILYSISARDPGRAPGFFDGLQLLLVVCALLVDAFALWAISARISEFGVTPNRVAALGENLILLVNLAGSGALYARFLGGRAPLLRLERWQTSYLPVYAVWAWIVVLAFPPLFGFR